MHNEKIILIANINKMEKEKWRTIWKSMRQNYLFGKVIKLDKYIELTKNESEKMQITNIRNKIGKISVQSK